MRRGPSPGKRSGPSRMSRGDASSAMSLVTGSTTIPDIARSHTGRRILLWYASTKVIELVTTRPEVYRPRSSPFTTFPLALRGSSGTNSTALGTLKFAISRRDQAIRSSAVSVAPRRRTA